jgi:glycosyltransferase involved in cell wall biosynthesis
LINSNHNIYFFSEKDLASPQNIYSILVQNISEKIIKDIFEQNRNFDFALIVNSLSAYQNWHHINTIIKGPGHIWHANKMDFTQKELYFVNYVQPCRMLHVVEKNRTVNWRLSTDCLLIKNDAFHLINKLNHGYESIEMAILELGYKAIYAGYIIFFEPKLSLQSNFNSNLKSFSFKDQLLFIKSNAMQIWYYWASFRIILNEKKISLLKIIEVSKLHRSNLNNKPSIQSPSLDEVLWESKSKEAFSLKVSVIIITLGRYELVKGVIRQMLKQTLAPIEILVIDANSSESEFSKLFSEFAGFKDLVKILKADTAGQCYQRNQGIKTAIGDYVFFIDDDMEEVAENHLLQHATNILYHKAQVSSGIPQELNGELVMRNYLIKRVSDVFPTNDSLALKQAILDVGMFDVKMNKGQSEDHELGLRLFKNGNLLILDPNIHSLHLRAANGGLRTYGIRKTTYHLAKNTVRNFRLPHPTELYMYYKHFPEKQVDELMKINLLSTITVKGNLTKKIIKIFYGLAFMLQIRSQINKAKAEGKSKLIS